MGSKVITICSSASFYRQVLNVERELKQRGFKVKIPFTALKMKKSGNFEVSAYKLWFKNPKWYARKRFLMTHHFRKIKEGDAILVLNYKKKGQDGYIGGNVLMEMGLAFHYKKPIYIFNPISQNVSFLEEILGMRPVFLNGDLKKI